ncbi:MAG: gamma-glutamylcyclotransferase family protein [Anaerolineae bacterium]
MTEALFVYGTLQLPEVQQVVFGRLINGTHDVLDGYGRSSITLGRETYPIIMEQAGSSVEGMVLDVTAEELARADHYETDAYRRLRVTLRSGKEAWVYGK